MIASIIVGYKNEDLSIKYVREQLSKIRQDNVVVVVNNAATVEGNKLLANELNGCIINDVIHSSVNKGCRFFVINSKENLGFARANNLGAQFIQTHFPECEYLLFTNNDISIIDDNVVDVLINKMETVEGIGMITPNIIGVTGARQTPQPYPHANKFLKKRFFWLIGRPIQEVNYAEVAKEGFHYTFAECFFIVRAKDYADCGGMDPATFLYAEGLCFSERMLSIGLKYYFEPSVTVVHENGSTTSRSYNGARIDMMITKANNFYLKKYRHTSPFVLYGLVFVSRMYGYKLKLKKWLHRD